MVYRQRFWRLQKIDLQDWLYYPNGVMDFGLTQAFIAFIVQNLIFEPIGKKSECKFAIVNCDLFHQSGLKDGGQQAGHEKQCHSYVESAKSALTVKKVRDGGAKNCPSAGRANGHCGKDDQ